MNFIIHNWVGLLFLVGSFGFGTVHGYHEDKLQPASIIVMVFLLFAGFGFGASIKGLIDIFTK